MYYLFRRAAISVLLVGAVAVYSSVDRAMNWKPAKASVSYIDRSCEIIETLSDANHEVKSKSSYRGECSEIDNWEQIRSDSTKKIDGVAVVHLSYTAPQNGQAETSELRFDGRNDEFYQLRAGDEIDILVNNSDPTKVRKA